MRTPRVVLRSAVLALVTAALAGCAVKGTVHSYTEPSARLGAAHRYAWAPPDQWASGDPRLDGNEIVQAEVRAAVDRELAARGYRPAAADPPEIIVHMHASVAQRIDLREREPLGSCTDCRPFIYDAGTLIVDVTDAGDGKVLWRGWAEGNVDGVVGEQRWLAARVSTDVSRMFERFPTAARGRR